MSTTESAQLVLQPSGMVYLSYLQRTAIFSGNLRFKIRDISFVNPILYRISMGYTFYITVCWLWNVDANQRIIGTLKNFLYNFINPGPDQNRNPGSNPGKIPVVVNLKKMELKFSYWHKYDFERRSTRWRNNFL